MIETSPTIITYPVIYLKDHITQAYNDIGEFSDAHGITPQQTLLLISSNDMWINERIFHRSTQNNPDFSITGATRAMLLSDHIDEYFEGSTLLYAHSVGESISFIENQCINGAMVAKDEVLTPFFTKHESFAMPLERHIEMVYSGNQTQFAKAHSSTQQQVNRWVTKQCVWFNGEVYMRRTTINEIGHMLSNKMDAPLLREHINETYGGDDRAFCKHNNIRPQQLERYLEYDARWINGDIYKNQSKFIRTR